MKGAKAQRPRRGPDLGGWKLPPHCLPVPPQSPALPRGRNTSLSPRHRCHSPGGPREQLRATESEEGGVVKPIRSPNRVTE